jgi:hypothetical protein
VECWVGVAQHDTTHPVRAGDVDGHADRPTPVLPHGQVAVEVEMIHQFAHHLEINPHFVVLRG